MFDGDIAAIIDGLKRRGEVTENELLRDPFQGSFDKPGLNFLSNLIASGRLEIKIAKLKNANNTAMFHDKFGLMYDADGNVIAFSGSMNETVNAFRNNYESIDVFTSRTSDADRIKLKETAFDSLWNNRADGVEVSDFITAAGMNNTSTEHISEILRSIFERLHDKPKNLCGVPTGFADLDKILNGLHNSDLILLAARPSMGKTALALNIAVNAAKCGKIVAMFSLEMSRSQIGIRLLSAASGISASKISTGKGFSDSDNGDLLDGLAYLENTPLFVDDTSSMSVAEMRMTLWRYKLEFGGLDLIVVDYLQLMRGKGENRVQEISGISRGLKALAKEFNVPVLALSQLNRQVEMRTEKKPQLSDLRDSGTLEQDADIVMFLYRKDYYDCDDIDQNIAELIIAKNRNGPTASVELHFNKETLLFSDLLREY